MNGDGEEADARPESTRQAGEVSDVEAVTLPWSEQGEREFKDIFASATVVLLLALAVVGLFNAAQGEPGGQLGSAVFALALAAVAMLSWYGPFGSVGARVSVDRHGLWIRHRGWTLWPSGARVELLVPRHLPASEIGIVKAVSEDRRGKMWRKSMALRYEGKRLGWTRITVDKESIDAVLIEQRNTELKRPWWLVKCRQRDELVRALELAKTFSDGRSENR